MQFVSDKNRATACDADFALDNLCTKHAMRHSGSEALTIFRASSFVSLFNWTKDNFDQNQALQTFAISQVEDKRLIPGGSLAALVVGLSEREN